MDLARRKGSSVCPVLSGMIPEAFGEVPSLLSGLAYPLLLEEGLVISGESSALCLGEFPRLFASPTPPCMPWSGGRASGILTLLRPS